MPNPLVRSARAPAMSALGLAAVLVMLVALPAATAPIPSGSAWIDEPLTGSTHPFGDIAVTVHATDPSGVSQVHLWVGDEVIASAAVPQPGPILVTETFTWTPDAPGEHLLTVRSVGVSGDWSGPAVAIVTITDQVAEPSATPRPSGSALPGSSDGAQPSAPAGASAQATPTPTPVPTARPTPRPTPAPTVTPRPTPVPCSPAAPDLLAPTSGVVIRDPASNPPTFRWAHRTPPACTPTGYRVQVFDDADLGHVVQDVTLSAVLQWTPASSLPDCTTYFWRVATRAPGGNFGPWSAPSSFELFVGRCD